MRCLKKIKTNTALLCFGLVLLSAGVGHARPWSIPRDFDTIQNAVDNARVRDGDTLIVHRGRHAGAVITKSLRIMGRPGAIIDSGPVFIADYPCVGDMQAGFELGIDSPGTGNGTIIQNLVFDNVAFPVYAKNTDNLEIVGNIMVSPIQGITNRGGRQWRIHYNRIQNLRSANGGAIAIFLADSSAREGGVTHNLVEYNTISGTLAVNECDTGGYSGGGIFLNADFRNGANGAEAIFENIVSWNRIEIVSDTPEVVDAAGIVLDDSSEATDPPIIFDNLIMFNDLHKMETAFVLAPESLATENIFYWNWYMLPW